MVFKYFNTDMFNSKKNQLICDTWIVFISFFYNVLFRVRVCTSVELLMLEPFVAFMLLYQPHGF